MWVPGSKLRDPQAHMTGALLLEPFPSPQRFVIWPPTLVSRLLWGISNSLGRTDPITPVSLCPGSEPVCDEPTTLLSAGTHSSWACLPTTLLLHLQIVTTEGHCCRATGHRELQAGRRKPPPDCVDLWGFLNSLEPQRWLDTVPFQVKKTFEKPGKLHFGFIEADA